MPFFPSSKKLQHHVQLGSLLLMPTTKTRAQASGSIKEGEEFIPVVTADVNFSSNLYFSLLFYKLKPFLLRR